jgi:Na+/H+ antiporter NhaD/arsenite permease-like protein
MIATTLILIVFVMGYIAIIAEHYLKINKTAVALFVAVVCWAIYLYSGIHPTSDQLAHLGDHVNHIAQIVFFLLGAMTIVELIDAHEGFKAVSNCLKTSSKRKLMVIVSVLAFFLSSVLDNLTTTILMVSILRKLVPERKDRLLLCCIVVVAANSGGAWTPIGDVTTTMLWIDGQISSWAIMKALFLPSVVSLLIPLAIYLITAKGKYQIANNPRKGNDTWQQTGSYSWDFISDFCANF